jgi:hypothetical protein
MIVFNGTGQDDDIITVCRGCSGLVGHYSDKSAISRELDMNIMFCQIGSVVSCAASRVGDHALIALSSCTFPSGFSPSVVHRSEFFPFSAVFRDYAYVQDQKEINDNVLCLHIWLHCSIGIPDSILNLLEQSFNSVLEADECCHLAIVSIVVSKLGGIYETVGGFEVH